MQSYPIKTKIGDISIIYDEASDQVTSVTLSSHLPYHKRPPEKVKKFQWALTSYFQGKEIHLTSELQLKGTTFQKKAWHELLTIPFGQTRSYHEVAKSIGYANAYRAVGTAVSKNPYLILIPCHRVLKNDGSIGGFAWGTKIKKILLDHEKTFSSKANLL
ncbi:MAG: methylated-DNA--[protein]-cysteine S-methyltransferase [Gammaproteobacteria bacterium]|jgi:methylated-DNA-[protein]-cysteine S-methyltransferase